MKKKFILKKMLVLEDKDIHTIAQCLNYAYHRLTKHHSSGIKGVVELNEVNRLRRELGIKLNI